jgi:Putative Actinobacterial Holin-X, holin superfamily III
VSAPLGGDGTGGNGRGGADTPDGSDIPRGIATAIAEISDRATLLVREEIELAKAEVTAKATKLVRGAVIGVAAGVFVVTALFFFLIGCAWLLYYYLPGNAFTYFWGFFAMALILLVLGVLAGLIAARAVKRGAPPMPDMAIEEARLIRDTVSSTGAPEVPSSAPGQAGVTTAASAPAPAPYGAAAPHATGPVTEPSPTSTDNQGAA